MQSTLLNTQPFASVVEPLYAAVSVSPFGSIQIFASLCRPSLKLICKGMLFGMVGQPFDQHMELPGAL